MRIESKKTNLLFPMPVCIIATYNDDDSADIMNAAWVTMEDNDVILIELARDHQTSSNILKRKAFTLSFGIKKYVKECDYVGLVSYKDDKGKIKKSNFTLHKSEIVNAPIINELPVSLECQVIRIDETNNDFAVYGKIVRREVDENYLTNGQIDFDKCEFITYNSIDHSYRVVSSLCANAFNAGLELKK